MQRMIQEIYWSCFKLSKFRMFSHLNSFMFDVPAKFPVSCYSQCLCKSCFITKIFEHGIQVRIRISSSIHTSSVQKHFIVFLFLTLSEIFIYARVPFKPSESILFVSFHFLTFLRSWKSATATSAQKVAERLFPLTNLNSLKFTIKNSNLSKNMGKLSFFENVQLIKVILWNSLCAFIVIYDRHLSQSERPLPLLYFIMNVNG